MTPSASGELQIFICYRRADTSGEAVALSDKLNRRRGFEVFKDVDNIRPGQDWLETVEESIEHCDVLLVLIGNDWIGTDGDEGHSFDENDHVRREIEAALARKKAVIPILFETADMPRSDVLPESVRPLLRRQSLRIRNSTFNRDLEVLVSQLRVIARAKAPAAATTSRPLRPPPPPLVPAQPESRSQSEPEPIVQPAYQPPATYQQPAAFTQAAPTFSPTQPPTQYQPSWPGPGSWTAGWAGQVAPSQSITRTAQASAIGLFVSGGVLAFTGLVAVVIPNVIVTDDSTPTDFIVVVGLLFGVAAIAQFLAGYGVLRRWRWSGWVGGVTAAVAAGVFLLGGTPLTFAFAIGELLIVGGLATAGRGRWFPPPNASR